MNAAGTFVPPVIIFPTKNMKEELMDGASAGSISACHPSGWIQTHIFTQWFDHFVAFVKPSVDDPAVLILDGHYSHTKYIDIVDKARQNYVHVACLPPHSTEPSCVQLDSQTAYESAFVPLAPFPKLFQIL
jgi:hypothetical protein